MSRTRNYSGIIRARRWPAPLPSKRLDVLDAYIAAAKAEGIEAQRWGVSGVQFEHDGLIHKVRILKRATIEMAATSGPVFRSMVGR